MSDQDRKTEAIEALLKTGGNVQNAAALLGIPLRTFYRALHRWGLMGTAGRQAAHVAGVAGVPAAGRKAITAARDKDVAGVPQVDEGQEISLDSIRAGSRLAGSEMSTEPIHVQAQRGRPANVAKALREFFGADRWRQFEQMAIDYSSRTREWTAPEHIILVAVDLGLPEVMKDVAPEGKGKK